MTWVAWELWQLAWLQEVTFGIAGVFVVPWTGLGLTDGEPTSGALSLVGLPVVFGALTLVSTAVLAWRGPDSRVGTLLFALGALGALGWAVLAGVLGVGSALDGRLQLPVFAVGLQGVYDWMPWGRWVFDATTLVAIAVLLGFGPRTALARRALWVGLLCVLADSAWRVGVTLFAGQIPVLYRGLGAGDRVFASAFGQSTSLGLLFVWLVLGGLAVLFVALFANLPNRDGPHRSLVLLGLAVAGLWLGLQAAALYSVGLLVAMGSEPLLFWPIPEYHGMLAFLRLSLVATGAATLGLAAWRAGE
ncbi:MAG: hypothetical protein R3F61_27765 [Myxococcota bacterium]